MEMIKFPLILMKMRSKHKMIRRFLRIRSHQSSMVKLFHNKIKIILEAHNFANLMISKISPHKLSNKINNRWICRDPKISYNFPNITTLNKVQKIIIKNNKSSNKAFFRGQGSHTRIASCKIAVAGHNLHSSLLKSLNNLICHKTTWIT